MTAITGNTYPVRRELRDMGGEWDSAKKTWFVPDDKADHARAILPVGRHGERAAARPYSNGGSRSKYANKRGRCEDAPCCGCCS